MKNENKRKTLSFRCTDDEQKIIRQNADRENLSLSNYMVHSCLHNSSASNNTKEIIAVLVQIENLIIKLKNDELNKRIFIKKSMEELQKIWFILK